MIRRLAPVLVAAALAIAAPARAVEPGDGRAEAAALVADADRAEAEMRFADALALYRAAFARDPSAPTAPRARARAEELAAHAEGGFAPLAALERVRRDPARTADRRALEELATAAAAFPPGRVRTETRLLLGGAFARLGDPARAAEQLRAVVADGGADRVSRALAMTQLADVLVRAGDLAGAHAAVTAFPDVSPATRERVVRAWRRRWIRGGAIALVAAAALAGGASLVALARAGGAALARRAASPGVLAVAVWIAAAGALLVRGYDESDPRPFLWLGAGALLVGTAARAWGEAAARGVGPRLPAAARAILCVAAILAAAFLALDASDPMYLDSFHL